MELKTILEDLYINLIVWLRKQKYSDSYRSKFLYGQFYVSYPDGNKSIKMYYKHAKDYCDMFGGTVYTVVRGYAVEVYYKPKSVNEKKEN